MILAANQPYFCPFPGFFYKAHLCDVFVILDAVQFPRGTTWLNRNRFKNDQGPLWMTVPVKKKGLGLQRIDHVQIDNEGRWARKHLESLKTAYGNAPYFDDHRPFLDELFLPRYKKLLDLNLKAIHYLMHSLHIDTKVVLLSELNTNSKGDQLIIDICNRLGASQYLAQSAAKKYFDADLFGASGIRLTHFRSPTSVYPQLWGDFIPNLSTLDLVFNCGPKARDILVGR